MAIPMVSSQKNLTVIATGIARGLDDQEAELARIGAFVEVRHGHGVAVIPARARGLRREAVEERLALRNNGRSLLGRAILFGRNIKTVPMDEIGIAGVVDDIDADRFAVFEPERLQRPLSLP